jgi:hypothetical protein
VGARFPGGGGRGGGLIMPNVGQSRRPQNVGPEGGGGDHPDTPVGGLCFGLRFLSPAGGVDSVSVHGCAT